MWVSRGTVLEGEGIVGARTLKNGKEAGGPEGVGQVGGEVLLALCGIFAFTPRCGQLWSLSTASLEGDCVPGSVSGRPREKRRWTVSRRPPVLPVAVGGAVFPPGWDHSFRWRTDFLSTLEI